MPGVSGEKAPAVEFSEPTWTGGTVALDAPQAEELVSRRVAEGPPSLLAGNIAVFSMDLTAPGATFMERTLVGDAGQPVSDLTPLQVGYELSFWARLPPVSIRISVESEKVYEHVRKIMDGKGVDHCTTYDFAYSDITTETARAAGLIDVQIDTGSASLPPEQIDQLRQYALDLVQQMIENQFFTDEPPGDDDDGDIPRQQLGGDDTKKYLKQTFDTTTMQIELNLEQRSVVEWKINPRSTLETFFRGRSRADLQQFVRTVRLDDDFFKSLGLTVRAFADYSDKVISAVEVQLEYSGNDEAGRREVKTETLTFTADSPGAKTWNPSLLGGQRAYRYRHRVGFRERGFGPYSEWQTSSQPELNIAAMSGRVEVAVLAGDVNFTDYVDQLQVTLAYEDAAAGIGRQEHTVLLGASRRDDSYRRLIYDVQRQPVQYRTRMRLKSGEVLDDGEWRAVGGPQLVVNQPEMPSVRVQPVGNGWDEVLQAIVDLRYGDQEESVVLRTREEFKIWRVAFAGNARQPFDYRISASYKDGRFEQRPWRTSPGDDVLPVEITAPPRLKVQLLADQLDLAAAPVCEVTLRCAVNGTTRSETLVFRDKAPQTWVVPMPEGAPVDYTYQVTHYPAGGSPVVGAVQREQDTVVVLPPYRAPRSGKVAVAVRPTLLDFTRTPLVVVDLRYVDDATGDVQTGSLAFERKDTQTWEFTARDVNSKRYSYTVTTFTPSGDAHTTEPQTSDSTNLIVRPAG